MGQPPVFARTVCRDLAASTAEGDAVLWILSPPADHGLLSISKCFQTKYFYQHLYIYEKVKGTSGENKTKGETCILRSRLGFESQKYLPQ